MRVLIDRGANINYKTRRAKRLSFFSCANNQFAAAKILFQKGADINTIDNGGGTPLDWAVCWCSPDFRQWLKSIGGERKTDHEEWDWETITKPALAKQY